LSSITFIFSVLASAIWIGQEIVFPGRYSLFLEYLYPLSNQPLPGVLAWFAVPVISLIGGVLAFRTPFLAGTVALACVLGWVAMALILPPDFDPAIILAAVLAGAATLTAYVDRERRQSVLRRRQLAAEFNREFALRLDPSDRPPGLNMRDFAQAQDRAPSPARIPLSLLAWGNALVLILLTGAVAFQFYVDYRSGNLALALDRGADTIEIGSIETLPREEPASSVELAALVEPPPVPSPERAVAALAQPVAFDDPFVFCRAAGTVDRPDGRYTGPEVPPAVALALGVPEAAPADRVKWRCVEGAVWACASYGRPVCAVTPTIEEMTEFCKRYPGAQGMQAPNGTWSCEQQSPVIPIGETWPVDALGFLPGAWRLLVPAPAPATPGAEQPRGS
jgi:hypothetical protein